MNIIKLDNEKKDGRSRISEMSPKVIENGKENPPKAKRLSSATKARIEQKQLIQQMLLKSSSNSPRRAVRSNRMVSSASPAVSSQRRDGKYKTPERPKSSTPRSGRQRTYNGKSIS